MKDYFEVAIESWPEWDLNPQPLNSIQIYIFIGVTVNYSSSNNAGQENSAW